MRWKQRLSSNVEVGQYYLIWKTHKWLTLASLTTQYWPSLWHWSHYYQQHPHHPHHPKILDACHSFNQIHRVLCSIIECQGIIKLPWFGCKETQGITSVTYGAGSFEAEDVFFCSAFYLLSHPLLSMTCIFHCMGFSCCCYIYTHLCTHLSTHIIVEMDDRNEYINYYKFWHML